MALVHSLYRQCLKKSAALVKHYGGDFGYAHRAVFGRALQPDRPIDGQYAVEARELIRHLFTRRISVKSETRALRVEAAFDALNRLQAALPSDESDKKYFAGKCAFDFGEGNSGPQWFKLLGEWTPRVVIPSEPGNTLPLNRHLVPSEPFHPVFLSSPWSKFPWLVPFLHQAVGPHVAATFDYSNSTNAELMAHIPTTTTCVTNGIEVECRTQYVGLESSPTPPHPGLESATPRPSHVFRYVIAIRNLHPPRAPESATVALLSRHWLFVDSDKSQAMEVVGPGVVGEFPLLEPGDRHVYQSGVSLYSPHGVMSGSFQMILLRKGVSGEEAPTPEQVDIQIAPTSLLGK